MSDSYVIIGDGIAGASAAETLREEAPDAEITVLTDEGESLYNRILIKSTYAGKLPRGPDLDPSGIVVRRSRCRPPAQHGRRRHRHRERRDPHPRGRHVRVRHPPARGRRHPQQLPVGNADADGIHHFWTFQDARKIKQSVEDADRAVIVGAGLLGIDFAAICGAQDVEAKYLMRGDSWWRYALSEEGAEIMHDAMRERGVEPVFGSGVDHFEVDEDGHVEAAVDPNGDRYECDFAGVAIGLNFNTELVEDTSLETENGIVVDEFMRTNVDNVFAAGDITTFNDLVLGEQAKAKNGSWGRASKQGNDRRSQHALEYGGSEEFEWVSSYSITHFDFPFLSFGHPTLGDDSIEATTAGGEWRRVALKDGKVVGGVLIGDLSPQSAFKQLMREGRDVRPAGPPDGARLLRRRPAAATEQQ